MLVPPEARRLSGLGWERESWKQRRGKQEGGKEGRERAQRAIPIPFLLHQGGTRLAAPSLPSSVHLSQSAMSSPSRSRRERSRREFQGMRAERRDDSSLVSSSISLNQVQKMKPHR